MHKVEDPYIKYCSEINRFDSFKNYKSTDCNFTQHTQEDYARAGFYSTGVGEEIKCNFCHLKINRLVKHEEDPITLHCRLNSSCPFMRRQQTDNIPIDVNLLDTFLPKQIKVLFSDDTPRPKYPEYSTIQSRLNSFRGWPSNSPIRVIDLVSAGFYYAGYDDRVGCFSCGLGLYNFDEGEIPLETHKQLRSECVFIRNLSISEPDVPQDETQSRKKKFHNHILILGAIIIVSLISFYKGRPKN